MSRHRTILAWMLIAWAGAPLTALASHWYGAELRYAPVEGYTYAITLELNTDLNSPADRPEVVVDMGDGTQDTLPRNQITDYFTSSYCGPVRQNIYQALHTFPGPGSYLMRFQDQNRSSGVLNIPNSINQAACVSALLVIDADLGANSSIVFETPQWATTLSGGQLTHAPSPADVDGDDLEFTLISAMGLGCTAIPGYLVPGAPAASSIEPSTGVFTWNDAGPFGVWNLTIQGTERRNGIVIGQVVRDLTICLIPDMTGLLEEHGPGGAVIRITADQVQVNAPGVWTVRIHDASGRLELQRMVHDGEGVGTSSLPPGVHLVQATDRSGRRLQARFVVTSAGASPN
ncbi:MAG TPA: T9SS type A sorting domain-containing protein [Flavobacteriales bacterium]|nr:T9SS type A sorting domain-containing protein [Flavobacteriales bacterium]